MKGKSKSYWDLAAGVEGLEDITIWQVGPGTESGICEDCIKGHWAADWQKGHEIPQVLRGFRYVCLPARREPRETVWRE